MVAAGKLYPAAMGFCLKAVYVEPELLQGGCVYFGVSDIGEQFCYCKVAMNCCDFLKKKVRNP